MEPPGEDLERLPRGDVGRGDVDDLVAGRVALGGEPDRVREVVGVDVGPEALGGGAAPGSRGRGWARSCPPTAPTRGGSRCP